MTISTTAAKSRYAGDGSTTSFPTGFKFLHADHVRVLLQAVDGSEMLWTEGSEYSLTGAGAPGGGTVQVATSPIDHTPDVGETLVVKLAVPPRQETSLPLGGAFPSTAVEAMADLAALRDQQIEEALSRAPKFKETTALAEVVFPEPEAGKPVGWAATGDALVNLEAIGLWQGDWTTATGYVALDVVRDPATKNVYVCEVAHTSATFATDLAAGKWSEAINVEDAEAAVTAAETARDAAQVARLAAETAEANAETAQAAAAASAASASTSVTNAGNSATAAAGSAGTASAAATAAQTAETNSQTAQAAAEAAQAAAETAETNAEAAQAAAETAATNAGNSATAATASAAAAEALYEDLAAIDTAVTAAQTAETNAETAQAAAETAQAAAESAQAAAATSATNAGNSATAAAASASAAAASESNAATYEAGALSQALAAFGSASTASGHATDAANSASAAAASAAQVEDAKLIWQGDWSGATSYAVNDAVAHDGASWICIEAHTNQEPPNPSYWDMLAAKGDQGEQGIQGDQGEQGIQGMPGDDGIGIDPKGTYSAGANYALDDGVTYQGSFWRSLQNANQGNTPTISPSYWELMVSKGDPGNDGDDGADGIFSQIASQSEAEAGIDNTKGMTPLRTAQAIAAMGGSGGGGIELLDTKNCTGQSTVSFLEIDLFGDFARFLFVIVEPIGLSNGSAIFFAEIGEFGGSNWETGAYQAFGHSVSGNPASQAVWRETNRIRLCPTGGAGDEIAGEFWYSTGGEDGVHPYPAEPRWTWQMGGTTHFSAGGGGWTFDRYLKNDVRFRVSMGSMSKGLIALFGVHHS